MIRIVILQDGFDINIKMENSEAVFAFEFVERLCYLCQEQSDSISMLRITVSNVSRGKLI
jgi:hypothetical protein